MKEVYKNTNGKVRVVQKKNLTDLATGEQFEAITITKDFNSDNGFKKMFIGEILSIIDDFSSARMKFIFWLFDNLDYQNKIMGTYEIFAEKSTVSIGTIRILMPILLKTNVLKKIQIGVYMINPDLVTSVKSSKRENLLIQYRKIEDEP